MNSLETVGYIEHDGLFLAFTLEPSKDNKKHPCIPFGTFNIMREYPSSKFGMVPALMKVPYRTGILIHSGNVASQSQGCILVGDDIENSPRGCHFITHSKVTLSMLHWKFGFISFGSHGGKVLNSFAATKYVCKYIRKDAQSIDDENKLPVSIRPFSPLISNGIGFHVYKDLSENDILDLFRKGSVTLLDAAGNPKVFPIPTYYRRKLLYDVSRIYSVDSSQFADTEQLDGVNRFYYDVQSMQLQEFSQEYKDFISSAKLYDIKTNFRLIPKKIYYNVRYEEYLNAVKYTRDALINILSNFKNIITDDKISQIAAVTHRNYPAAHVLFQSLQAEFRCDNFTRASEYIGFYRCRFIPYTLLAHDNNFHAATVHRI
ncbi:unnamed protein product [Cylicocyclus nassatus]|uniref:DUF5675 domain-containing protein n=1 Tax=Cylicocyclus nassatus TaxID=53992 RepID=A0AA36DT52_CYLNA|nr:unnamed protein product [Cylicocyclus nassatus]